jgi:hypothetical protein
MGGQAPLKFVLPPEKSRHGADTIYKLGLHHKYTMKINYKGQVIWVLQFYSQAFFKKVIIYPLVATEF